MRPGNDRCPGCNVPLPCEPGLHKITCTDCLCLRGPAVGTLTHTSGRMHFRAFHDGPPSWHHENSADWACLDCVADTAARIASGEVREDMRRIGRERPMMPR